MPPEGTKEGQWLQVDVPNQHQSSVRTFLAAASQNSAEAGPPFTREQAAGEVIKGQVQRPDGPVAVGVRLMFA